MSLFCQPYTTDRATFPHFYVRRCIWNDSLIRYSLITVWWEFGSGLSNELIKRIKSTVRHHISYFPGLITRVLLHAENVTVSHWMPFKEKHIKKRIFDHFFVCFFCLPMLPLNKEWLGFYLPSCMWTSSLELIIIHFDCNLMSFIP